MRHLVEQAKSLAEVSKDVKAMRGLIAALQEPLTKLDQQGLLDAFPTELKMREWLGDTFDVREILDNDRLYPDLGSVYRDYSGIDVKKLPLWMRQAENSWQELSAAYEAALDRGHGWSVVLSEWQQRLALAGGVLLSKDSPFVRLEATMRGGVWQRGGGARGAAEAVTPPPAAAETARSISDPDLLDPGGALRRSLGIPTDRQLYGAEISNLQELVDANAALRAARGTGRGVGVPPSERLAPSATSRMYGPSGPLYEQAIVRTPFGDFLLEFTGKKTARTVKILQGPEGLESWPAKTGPRVSTTRAPLGPGISFKDYDTAVSKLDNWAQEVFENRWTGTGDVDRAQGAVGRSLLDPARQGGVPQALATLTGRTETTGFYGVEGLAWLDAPMWQLPVDLPDTWKVLTQAERELLTDAERLNHLAYASEHYRTAQAAMVAGLDVEAQIATMQGRIRQLYAERDIAKGEYAAVRAAGKAAKEAGEKGVREDVAPKLYDGARNDIDEFQAGLRKFNAARTRDLFGEALTAQPAAQWGPNTASPGWSRGWTAPLQNEDQATPLFEMLNALFKTTSTTGDFSTFLKWYDKFLNYWKAQAVSTPGFVLRNGLGGSWLSYAFGLMELGSTNKFAGTYFRAMRSGKGDAVAGIDGMIGRLLAG